MREAFAALAVVAVLIGYDWWARYSVRREVKRIEQEYESDWNDE